MRDHRVPQDGSAVTPADQADGETIELTSGGVDGHSRVVWQRPKDRGGLIKHAGLLVSVAGAIGYFIGVHSLSGFAKELGISASELGVDFRDYVLFAMLSSLAIIAGLITYYLLRLVFDAPVKGTDDDRRTENKWRPAIAAFFVAIAWFIARPGLPDFSDSGMYEISVVIPGALAGLLAGALVSSYNALSTELEAREKNNKNNKRRLAGPRSRQERMFDWWVGAVTAGMLVALYFLLLMVYDLGAAVHYGLSDWPAEYAQELRKWSYGTSPDAPDEPDTLDLILKPVLVAFELDDEPQCGIRVSKNVVLQEGETIMIGEPDAFRVGACSLDGQDFVPRPER